MKYLVTSLSISIITLALTACNDKTEATEDAKSLTSAPTEQASNTKSSETVQEDTNEDKKPTSVAEETNTSNGKDIAAEEKEKSTTTNKPLDLNDFRSAINDVVQDSIQEAVESAVEAEVSKSSNK